MTRYAITDSPTKCFEVVNTGIIPHRASKRFVLRGVGERRCRLRRAARHGDLPRLREGLAAARAEPPVSWASSARARSYYSRWQVLQIDDFSMNLIIFDDFSMKFDDFDDFQ